MENTELVWVNAEFMQILQGQWLVELCIVYMQCPQLDWAPLVHWIDLSNERVIQVCGQERVREYRIGLASFEASIYRWLQDVVASGATPPSADWQN